MRTRRGPQPILPASGERGLAGRACIGGRGGRAVDGGGFLLVVMFHLDVITHKGVVLLFRNA